jgi:hypothetical protein
MNSTTRIPPGPLTLPVEIVVMILEPFIPLCQSRRELVSVINLSGVCRYWRRIIISTPIFWTKISLEASYRGRKLGYEHYLACLELQLQRTGTKLLDVSYYINGDVEPELSPIVQKYAPLERWRTLSLCLTRGKPNTPSRHTTAIIPYEEGNLKNLEELTLYGNGLLTRDLIDLVEGTAMRLRRFKVGMTYSPILKSKFPKTLRRIETKTSGELSTLQ